MRTTVKYLKDGNKIGRLRVDMLKNGRMSQRRRIVIWTLCLILIEANADGVDAEDASEGLARSDLFPLYYKEGTGASIWNKIWIKSR